MENIIIQIMNGYGYIGIFSLILIENLFPPIPSEVILTFGGFMTYNTNLTIIGVIISSTIGSIVGSLILYYLGKVLNKERLIKIVNSKWGKLLKIKQKNIEQADNWFDTKGNKTVLFCRCIPVVRSLISIPAGMSEMPIIRFVLYTLFGSTIWNTMLVLVGAFASDKKDLVLNLISKTSYLICIILLIISIMIFYNILKKIRKQKK